MSSKLSPGAYDCYANAEPDEPMFILLARDPLAEYLVAIWTAIRAGDALGAHVTLDRMLTDMAVKQKQRLPYTDPKSIEAQQCSKSMRSWRWARETENAARRLSQETP